jgi:hypothetical protein
MPTIPVTIDTVSPALRKAASTLKAAAVVSAAAILSRSQSDLEANAAAAAGHFDDVAQQLHAMRNNVLKEALDQARPQGGTTDVDIDLLDQAIGRVDDGIALTKEALIEIAGSAEREGLDSFVQHIGDLGRALQDVAATLGEQLPSGTQSFLYDQFFLESMHELAQRDWRTSTADET